MPTLLSSTAIRCLSLRSFSSYPTALARNARPVPRADAAADTNQKLNVQNVNEMKELFRPKHWRLTRRDLMRLTWTTKYKWEKMERYHERKVKSIRSERERPYL